MNGNLSSEFSAYKFPFSFTNMHVRQLKVAITKYTACLKGHTNNTCFRPIVRKIGTRQKRGEVTITLQKRKAMIGFDVISFMVNFEPEKAKPHLRRILTSKTNILGSATMKPGKKMKVRKTENLLELCRRNVYRCFKLTIYGVQQKRKRRLIDQWSALKILNHCVKGLTAMS